MSCKWELYYEVHLIMGVYLFVITNLEDINVWIYNARETRIKSKRI